MADPPNDAPFHWNLEAGTGKHRETKNAGIWIWDWEFTPRISNF
jgi:hypothetical protein